jgi:hypothetical protein
LWVKLPNWHWLDNCCSSIRNNIQQSHWRHSSWLVLHQKQ